MRFIDFYPLWESMRILIIWSWNNFIYQGLQQWNNLHHRQTLSRETIYASNQGFPAVKQFIRLPEPWNNFRSKWCHACETIYASMQDFRPWNNLSACHWKLPSGQIVRSQLLMPQKMFRETFSQMVAQTARGVAGYVLKYIEWVSTISLPNAILLLLVLLFKKYNELYWFKMICRDSDTKKFSSEIGKKSGAYFSLR